MKRIINLFSGLLLIATIWGCATSTSDEDLAVIEGIVYYLDQNSVPRPLEGALIYAKNIFAQTKSNADGSYRLTFEPENDEISVDLVASKAGFETQEINLLTRKGETVQAPDITLSLIDGDSTEVPADTTGAESGKAAHIELYRNPPHHIYIKSSGLKETALVHFIVTDSEGIPVDENHKVKVYFSILNGPEGGEYLFPDTMTTESGLAYTILNSGTIAGPVQVQAEAIVDGQAIRSTPVRLTIYGGLPDQEHFSVTLSQLNIAGRVHYGIIDHVTAFVGDKYSNPVAPGTAIYFSSDYCIVDGASTTDEMGRATVKFMSASPLPPDPANNPFAFITAKTFSDTLGTHSVTSQARVLLSAATAPIEINPTEFEYNNSNTPIRFDYTVADVYGYPLVEDTRIEVSATDGNLYGDYDVTLRDTQFPGQGTTNFGITWAPGDSLKAPQVYIDITVNPPENGNGYRSRSILGVKTSE
ncbi:MAG: hypothetical protein GF313_02555 [Caldithrix sp.]|nr:hypothetical protein [Caldithrix sp.]